MVTFYICRHGESENNKLRRLSGWIDTPLTEKGVQDALSSATRLKGIEFDRIIASDLGRAFITAYIITKQIGFDGEIERAAELREVNYGDLANQPYKAYPDLSTDENSTFVPANGESLEAMQRRVLGYLGSINNDQDQNVLIVAHDGTINAVRAGFSGETMGEADTVHNPHDLVVTFNFINEKVANFQEQSVER